MKTTARTFGTKACSGVVGADKEGGSVEYEAVAWGIHLLIGIVQIAVGVAIGGWLYDKFSR